MNNLHHNDWIRSEADERAVAEGCYFDEAAGLHVIEFIETCLRYPDGQRLGDPIELFEWQKRDIIMPLFGWKRANGKRRFNFAYIEIPKKNGKTTLMAMLVLYLLIADGEPGIEVYSAAASKDQAGMIYEKCKVMAQKNPELARLVTAKERDKKLVIDRLSSMYRSLASDADTSEGVNGHVICDELHVWPKPDLYNSLRYAGDARANPMFAVITTAGDDLTGIGYQIHQQAMKIQTCEAFDSSFFAYIRGIEPDQVENGDWLDPEVWKHVNPSLGDDDSEMPLKISRFEQYAEQARQFPERRNAFLRYRLNLWIGVEMGFFDLGHWDACKSDLTVDDLIGQDCWCGIDLATREDIAAASFAFPQPDGSVAVRVLYWYPRDNRDSLSDKTSGLSDQWIEQGLIRLTDGNATDYADIRDGVLEFGKLHPIREIVCDPWRADLLANELEEAAGCEVLTYPQTMKCMSEPTKELRNRVNAHQLVHFDDPVLRWMAGCAIPKYDEHENVLLSKRRAKGKIDGIVASIMAVDRATRLDQQTFEMPDYTAI